MRGFGRRFGAVLGALGLIVFLGVAGCSSAGPAPSPSTSTPTAAERLAQAKAQVDAAGSVHLTLASRDLPSGISGVVSAEGWGTHAPAFKGTFQVAVRGTVADAEVVAVGGAVYAKLPFVPVFAQVDPATLGVPDPARLLDPTVGVTTLLTATKDPAFAGQTRRGSEVLTTITGTIDGRVVTDVLRVGDGGGTYAVTYGLTEPEWQLRTVDLTGPFFAGGQQTYTLTFDRYGEPVEIKAP